jgi:hypothetical protein
MTSGSRDICEVGGLMSYVVNIVDTYRQEGVYTGRLLKGATPAGSRMATALAAHHLRTGCAPWRSFLG